MKLLTTGIATTPSSYPLYEAATGDSEPPPGRVTVLDGRKEACSAAAATRTVST